MVYADVQIKGAHHFSLLDGLPIPPQTSRVFGYFLDTRSTTSTTREFI